MADLSPLGNGGRTVAVGWLERGHQHATGTVAPEVFAKLESLLIDPWQPAVTAGLHLCDLCTFKAEKSGTKNLFVPGDRRVYVAPELILHYVNAHQYEPPKEFCAAVMTCPPMRSAEYRRALLAAGGPDFLNSASTVGAAEPAVAAAGASPRR
jgi:hypothetical protein